MRFLDGTATTAEIAKLTESSQKVRMAVAFWGDGATEGLRLGRKGQSTTVVCNLRSGATNPHEIEKLIAKKISVQQCDTLHGKVYLFDEHVIVGSSNASANGLALQGNEIAGWSEANILTSDRSIYEAAERWIDKLTVREITGTDLEAAKIEFSKRRAVPTMPVRPNTSLLDAIREHPESFKDRRIYICVYLALFGQKEKLIVKREQEKSGDDKRIDALGWQVPTDATLLCFYVSNRNGVRFDGFWERPRGERRSAGPSPLYFKWKLPSLDGFSSIGLLEDWAKALLILCKDRKLNHDDAAADHIEMGEFYEGYLKHVPPRTKILNVLDARHRLRALENGKFESGFWSRPERGFDIVRVFEDAQGVSIRGGKILTVRDEIRRGKKTKVFVFADDKSEHGKSPPADSFRRNGCRATLELARVAVRS